MPPQPEQPKSFREQYAFALWLCQFPALSVMVFLRRDLGYRLLNPLSLIAVTGLLVVVSVLAQPGNADARPVFLIVFALCFFSLGMFQRLKRWRELNRDVRQHSYYIGTSPFDFHWLPMIFRRNRRLARFIDPLFCALIGAAFIPFSHALAMWLLFSAFCLRAYEYAIHKKERHLNLDTLDGLIVSEAQAETVERFEPTPGARPQPPSSGIPTGMGQDVGEHIKRRKTK